MTRRDPFAELGLPPDASPSAVKAAWRRLAREHHPDLARDHAEERAATRRMARINAAYEAALRLAEDRRSGRGPGAGDGGRGAGGGARGTRGDARRAGGAGEDGDTPGGARGGRSGRRAGAPDDDAPPGPDAAEPTRRARPVTRRVDTSSLFHAPGTRGGDGPVLPGQAPPRPDRPGPESLRGAPSGPVERHRPRRPPVQRLPDLATARAHIVPFGKFHDRPLGEVERVEPTYIDWIVRTIRRDPDLVAAARVVQAALDAAGVRRTSRPDRSPDGIGADPEV